MAIVTVPQLSDNYAYLVIDDGSKECAVVDCAEADKVMAAVKSRGAKIVAVLTTHWHGDHSGGNNDTMFVGGCGRVFEGKAATMVASLKKLASLPDSTQVYCGHEYTEKNLRFALTLEPHNAALQKKHDWSVKTRAENKFTVPSTIGDEKQTNPFLRTDSPELRANLKQRDPSLTDDPIAIFAKTRALKDNF
jgi:glyoxylase-like metal-dependent hydrolase (beta-lactamase superfamily II)